jgi:hypothetical protein
MENNMRTKNFKPEYMYNLGKNSAGQRIYMSGEEIVNWYQGSKGVGLNQQQSAKLRKIARHILYK